MKSRIIFILLFVFQAAFIFAQKPEKKESNEIIESLIEEIANNTDAELDYTQLFEDLNHYLQEPLNLNSATREDLEKLQILSELQVNSILNYLKKHGQFLTVYEIQLVYGFSVSDIQRILPFITVEATNNEQAFSFKKAMKYGSNSVLIRGQQYIEEQEGYSDISDSLLAAKPNSRYLGSPLKLNLKYKYQYKNKLYWGLTGEKDPGEEFFKGTQKSGFDFYSAHLMIANTGIIKALNFGDYVLQFGQGLTIWNGMSYGKSSAVMDVKKRLTGIRKYSSTDENLFMRGVATTISLKKFDISVFYSRKKIDANIISLDSIADEVRAVSSLQNSGLHTMPSEIDDKDAIRENVMGGNVTYNTEKFKLGLTYLNYFFDADINKNVSQYNKFDLTSNQNSNLGLDYQFAWRGINFFGETAASQNKGLSTVNGALFPLAPQVSLSMLHRHYEKDYQSYYGGAFAEGSKTANEDGFFIGTEIYPYQKWKIAAYYDLYSFPWLTSSASAPSSGMDYLVQVDFSPFRNVRMNWKFKQEIKQENSSIENVNVTLADANQKKFSYSFNYQVSDAISMKSRVDLSWFSKEANNSKGYLVYQDINYRCSKLPISLSFRYSIFDTDSWDARIYAYETDVLYAFSIPAFYMKGTRTYLMIKYDVSKNIDFWIRYAITSYSNLEAVGSGMSAVVGNKKSELKVQFRFKF